VHQADTQPISARWTVRDPEKFFDELLRAVEAKRWTFVRRVGAGDFGTLMGDLRTLPIGTIKGKSHVHEVFLHRDVSAPDDFVFEVKGAGWKEDGDSHFEAQHFVGMQVRRQL
jgi:hypothetical protein